MSEAAETDTAEGVAFIRALIGAWDCCGVCAGGVLLGHDRAAMARAWDERDSAAPRYLGPNEGHYDGCMGWEDCDCASYPNPYRA